jgi:hypothetical protein
MVLMVAAVVDSARRDQNPAPGGVGHLVQDVAVVLRLVFRRADDRAEDSDCVVEDVR